MQMIWGLVAGRHWSQSILLFGVTNAAIWEWWTDTMPLCIFWWSQPVCQTSVLDILDHAVGSQFPRQMLFYYCWTVWCCPDRPDNTDFCWGLWVPVAMLPTIDHDIMSISSICFRGCQSWLFRNLQELLCRQMRGYPWYFLVRTYGIYISFFERRYNLFTHWWV